MRTDWKTLREAKRAEDPEAYDAAYAAAAAAFRLGVLVREYRTAAGMTQTELARRSGTSQPAIARLEAGGAEPTVATLRRIADALGVELVVKFHTRPTAGVA
jgi:ribosome-binding protein aMBF1 (putative translation factor)